VSRGTWDPSTSLPGFAYGAVTPCGRPFQTCSATQLPVTRRPATPVPPGDWFRLLPVRSPLLGESRLISLPRPTEMFQFRRCPPLCLSIQQRVTGHYASRVSPFGHPRIYACLRLPEAFRSLPRPSSAPDAQASAACPFQLDLYQSSGGSAPKHTPDSAESADLPHMSPDRPPSASRRAKKGVKVMVAFSTVQFSRCKSTDEGSTLKTEQCTSRQASLLCLHPFWWMKDRPGKFHPPARLRVVGGGGVNPSFTSLERR
jgi:hypothetical protein